MVFASFLIFCGISEVFGLNISELTDRLERSPVIAATHNNTDGAVSSPSEIIFYLKANLLNVRDRIASAHKADKAIFIHIDLADGIGKDKTGIEFLKSCGADGIISTRGQLIRQAKDAGLLTVQRFFILDSQGISSMSESLELSKPDAIEIMPGVIPKAIKLFSGLPVPVIAGGLIETKQEVTAALDCGAAAVSTGKEKLWYI